MQVKDRGAFIDQVTLLLQATWGGRSEGWVRGWLGGVGVVWVCI